MNKVDFWCRMERMIRECLDVVWIFDDDADDITNDLMQRLRDTPVTPPSSVRPDFFVCLGAAMAALVTAEQRLVAAKTGKAVGLPIGGLPPMPFIYNHPFLMELQGIVAQLDAEADKYGRRAN